MSHSNLLELVPYALRVRKRWLSLYRKTGASVIEWQNSQSNCDNARNTEKKKKRLIIRFVPKITSHFLNVQ